MNKPLYYNLFLITTQCRTCGEEYTFPDLFLAREIPKGEAFSPPKLDEKVWDLPVHKKIVQRDVLFCSMCVDKIEKEALPKIDMKEVMRSGSRPETQAPVIELDLKALGLI